MADPLPFFVIPLAGQITNPIIPDAFFSTHFELMKLKLTSDASDRTWEVKLNGRRFSSGWEDFSAAHCLRDDDVLVFRHDSDMFFHVTPSGRSFSQKKQQCVSSSEEDDDEEMKQNRFWKVTLKPYMLTRRQIHLPRAFTRANEIKKAGKITLVDKHGVKWPSFVASANEQADFYMTKGWLSFCAANELKTGDKFTFEFVRREGKTPMLKFCSNAEIQQAPFDGSRGTVQASRDEEEDGQEETENLVQKRARVSTEGGPSRCTQASNESSSDPNNLQCKQPLQSCSISDQLTKVKQGIVDTLTGIRRFWSELEKKEQNLEASLKEIDALGEKVFEIKKFLK